MCCSADLFLGFLAILFPPLAVWVKTGLCSADSLINLLLCVLGYIPGLLHAWYIIAKFPEGAYEYERVPQDAEAGGRVTYVFVQQPRAGQQGRPSPAARGGHGGMNYGTNAASNNNNEASSSSAPAAGGSSSSHHHNNAPPTYAEAVQGDNKVQTQD
ncbi:hypothetical protein F5B20DRAFT_526859 [Whalleya microplaca]|nr:hypothetical protein F5B20DRAFT_526859 [Whalleya microplaca]